MQETNDLLQIATALHKKGQFGEAEVFYRRILEKEPEHHYAAYLLGMLANKLGRGEEAISLLRRAVVLRADQASYHLGLGIALSSVNLSSEAVEYFRRALQLQPNWPAAYNSLGNAYQRLGQFVAAIDAYREALRIGTEQIGPYVGLAETYRLVGDYRSAREALQRISRLHPDNPDVEASLGNIARDEGELKDAIVHYERSLELRTGSTAVHNNLGEVLRQLGTCERALSYFRKAIALGDSSNATRSNLLFTISYHVLYSPEQLLAEHLEWDRIQGAAGRAAQYVHEKRGDPEKRIKVGYVSPDFRRHSVSYFFEPILVARDPSQFEVYCYAEVTNPDEVTARLKSEADHWRSTVGLSDAEVARQVAMDGIDILVDLAGHTAYNRLAVFTYKPAPVQVTYLGYFATTGLDAMDYWLSDQVLTPADTVERATEEIWRLPRCCICYEPPMHVPSVAERSLDGPVVFGSFNALSKVSDEAIELWSAVLHAVPKSRIVLKARALGSDAVRADVRLRFAAYGIDGARLDLSGRTSGLTEHFAAYGEIDIALDTVPRTGGTTTADALWMGVPVISLAGQRFIERLSATMLTAVGLEELIATDREDYIAKAVALAQDPKRRARLRAEMRDRMAASDLCDGRGLAGALESAYRAMWRRYLTLPSGEASA